MPKLTQNDLIRAVAEDHGTTQTAVGASITAFLDQIAAAVENGDTVTIANFGTFKPVERSARKGRNPATGEAIEISASTSVGFKPSKALKDRVNG
ncbi:HU family DNA-binding protein [Epibacterium ulvae]|uniref:HU family DNA-binding protein n=1 Tax=Epibacterium ulvae TaxID=1156985 RepID=UPI00249106A1|nr:HU family DNA-binding protein [Epibacterium ulvae]